MSHAPSRSTRKSASPLTPLSDGDRGVRAPLPPSRLLLGVGMVVLVATIGGFVWQPSGVVLGANPALGALLFALGFALVLFGAFPDPKTARGKTLGFRLAGPVAIAILTFLLLRQQLVPGMRGYVVLQNASSAQLRNATLSGVGTVSLLDVDSFSDDKLKGVLDQLNRTLGRPSLEVLISRVDEHLVALGFGERERQSAADLVRLHAQGAHATMIDRAWATLVDSAAIWTQDELLKDRIKKQPFAVIEIADSAGTRREIVTAGEALVVGGRRFSVPIIANPAMKSTRGIEEAIVLQPAG